MNLKLFSGIIFMLISCDTIFAQDVYLKLTTGERKKMGVAVIELLAPSDSQKQTVKELKQIIEADLDFSLYFNLIKPETTFVTKSGKVDFPQWFSQGVTTLVSISTGIDLITKKQKKDLEITVYDVFLKRKISKKEYVLKYNKRATAHEIADDIIESLTGEKGINQTRILCAMKKGASKEILTMDYDGENLAQLTRTGELHLSPAWDTRGEYIMFTLYKGSNIYLYGMNLTNRDLNVFSTALGMNTAPSWSPNGNKLAFVLTKSGNSEIYTMSRERKNLTRLTVSGCINTSPNWSPNGNEIVFVSDRSGSPQIYIMGSDGSDARRLTFSGSYNTSPVWSPKGDRLAYVSQEGNFFQIYTISVNGESEMGLTYEGNNEEPSWSPDGLHLCFVSDRGGRYEVYTMHWDGSCQKKIVGLADGCYSSRWSPYFKTTK
ncbi:MAG: Tol-Pal system beta propeller repeat protein TolB [bacterium]|nr:Tol-Pal system beta propeller repeat protein TolB [bacterium]